LALLPPHSVCISLTPPRPFNPVASQDLQQLFSRSKDGSSRLIQVLIDNEYLVVGECHPPAASWDSDYEKLLLPLLRPDEPCYVLYRLDSQNAQGFEWIFISWIPMSSAVRHRTDRQTDGLRGQAENMAYVSLCRVWGVGGTAHAVCLSVLDNILVPECGEQERAFACCFCPNFLPASSISLFIPPTLLSPPPSFLQDEVTLKGYRSHLVSDSAPAPLTTAEQELKQLKITEMNTDVNVDTRQRTLQGIAFPVQDDALRALRQLQQKECHYVQLKLDIEAELITLVTTEPTGIAELPSRVPSDSPRWHFYLYQHTHEGSSLESL
ncbi:twinfilin-1-like, partial [Rhincodon typus]|uniref:twinfilin-1-like n=1 Tax=Rhincodon typus TaxID=259920 RepID=UPI002030D390